MSSNNDLAEAYGGPMEQIPSLYALVEQGLMKCPHEPAIIAMHQASDHLSELLQPSSDSRPLQVSTEANHLCWTYAQLHHAAVTIAVALHENGIGPDSVLLTLIPNGIEWVLLLYACLIARITMVPIDIGATGAARTAELKNHLLNLNPKAIVVANGSGIEAIERLAGHQTSLTLRVSLDWDGITAENSEWTTFLNLGLDAGESDRQSLIQAARDDSPDYVNTILFTSGTSSGRPKGCPRTAGTLAAAITGQRIGLLQSTDLPIRFLITTMNFRIIAPFLAFLLWSEGATMVLPAAAFSPDTYLEAVDRYEATNCMFIPGMIHTLTSHPSFASRNTSSVQGIILGGDIVTRSHIEEAQQSFPTAQVSAAHGMSEGGAFFLWPYSNTAEIGYHADISPLGTVGRGTRLKVVDNGKIVKRGEPGELHVCSASTIKGYLGGVNAHEFYTDSQGQHWFNTGDTVMMTADGLFYILGRTKDIIKRAGVPITPGALESSLQSLTNAPVAVFAIPHPLLGHEPFAVLASFAGKSEEEIKSHIVDVFGKDYSLGGAVSLDTLCLKSMPLNATGKVQKLDLMEPVTRYLAETNGAHA